MSPSRTETLSNNVGMRLRGLFGLGALLAGGCLGCTDSHPSPAASSPSSSLSPPSATALRAEATALRVMSGMAHVSNIVTTPAGQEAATWEAVKQPPKRLARNHQTAAPYESAPIAFWRYDDEAREWQRLGRNRYPGISFPGYDCNPKVVGGLVQGAPDATFLVHGCQSGDGGINALAFANGSRGWGIVEQGPSPNELRSRGQPRHITVSTNRWPEPADRYDMSFAGNLLETNDGNPFFAIAAKGAYARHTFWRWSGSGFVRVRDDAFAAAAAEPPDTQAPSLPSSECPSQGTYRASFGVKPPRGFLNTPHGGPLLLLAFPRSDSYPSNAPCQQQISATAPMTVQVAHTSAHRYFLHRGRVTNRRWVTAPSWFLLAPDLGGAGKRTPFFRGDTSAATSPYVVPAGFHVNEMLADLGHADSSRYRRNNGHGPHPANGTVTFRAGRIVALSVDVPRSQDQQRSRVMAREWHAEII